MVYYSHQCPFTAKVVPFLAKTAQKAVLPFGSILIDSREKAQETPAAVTNFALFYQGKFITHQILLVGKFKKRPDALGLV